MRYGTKPLTSKPGEFLGRCCRVTYVDRAAFETHMSSEHGGALARIFDSPTNPGAYTLRHNLPVPVPVKLWRGPRLKTEGQPLADRDGFTEECPTCGLVAEVRGVGAELWWTEHLEGCRLAQAGAAS